jgi:Spy/CpxP family protein refolding chaperone
MKRRRFHRVLAVALSVVLGVLLAPSPARAQMGMGGAMPGQGQISRRALDTYATLLQLDADQKAGVLTLFEGYQAGMKTVREDTRKATDKMQEKMRDGMDPAIFKELKSDMEPIGKRAEQLESDFFTDLKALLTSEQAGRFDRVERHRRRDKQMRFAMAAGARANLLEVVEATKLPEETPELREALETYELELDRVLLAREAAMKELEKDGERVQEKSLESMKTMDFSGIMEESMKLMKRGKEIEKPLREVHKTHARRIASILPPDKQAEFETQFRLRAFPRVYRQSEVSKQIGAALKFEDLTAEQRSQIEAIQRSYQSELDPLNERWAAAIEEKDDKGIVSFPMMPPSGGEPDPTTEPRKARRDLDKRVRDSVRSLLSDEQKERLPREERNQMDDMMDMTGMDIDPEMAGEMQFGGG